MKAKELIRVVSGLTRLYKKYADADNADFNIFSVLHKKNEEVRLHSRFIYELLNPHGTHGKNAEYLAAFLEVVRELIFFPQFENELLNKSVVEKEYDFIDLYIELPDGYTVIIENKIDAPDQDRQLERYQRTVIDDYKRNPDKLTTLYLTLDGHIPTATSIGDSKYPVHSISYINHIIRWLDKCLEISDLNSRLCETVMQYRNLVCEITGFEDGESDLDREIINVIINDKESFKSAKQIGELLSSAQTTVMQDLFTEIKKQVSHRTAIEPIDNTEGIKDYYSKDSNPYLAYPIKSFSKDGCKFHFCFFIEIDYCIDYGFGFLKLSENGAYEWANRELIKENNPVIYKKCETVVTDIFSGITGKNTDDICLYRENFFDSNDDYYDFGSFSENCIDLYANREQEVKRMCEIIIPLIKKASDRV